MRAVLVLSCLALASAPAMAQNLVMNHSGYLLDGSDAAVSNASLPMVFRIYNVRDLHGTGENLIWESKSCEVAVSRGFYNVSLGESCNGTVPLQATHIPPNETRFLEVEVNGTRLAPRLLLGAVPNAAVATVALEAKALKIAPGAGAGLVLLSDANGSGAWGTVGSGGITDGSIVDADISGSAAIATSKLSGPLTQVANNGLGSLAGKSAVTDAEIPADAAVSTSKLSGAVTAIANNGLGALATKSSIVDADLPADAAVSTSKLAGPVTAIANNGLGSLAGKSAIANADVAAGAAIATSKLSGPISAIANNGLGALATKSSIADADVAAGAAIAGSKISPDFGAQNVVTSGNVGIGASGPLGKLDVRGNGRDIVWGHSNGDYRSDIGALSSGGNPYIAFHGLHSSAVNTIQRNGTGFGPMVIMHDNVAGLNIMGAPAGAKNADVSLSTVASFQASGNVGIGTTTPAAKLDVNGDLRVTGPIHGQVGNGYRILTSDWVNISGMNCGSNPVGYMKLVTPIVHNESNMFSIHITYYGYSGGGFGGDIRCGGYAYSAGTLQSAGCTVNGVSYPVNIVTETRGGKTVAVIKIGSPTQNWYFQHFSYDYVGWQAHTPSEFQWVCGETN